MICVRYDKTSHKCDCGKNAKWRVQTVSEYKVSENCMASWYCDKCKEEEAG